MDKRTPDYISPSTAVFRISAGFEDTKTKTIIRSCWHRHSNISARTANGYSVMSSMSSVSTILYASKASHTFYFGIAYLYRQCPGQKLSPCKEDGRSWLYTKPSPLSSRLVPMDQAAESLKKFASTNLAAVFALASKSGAATKQELQEVGSTFVYYPLVAVMFMP